MKSVVVLLVTLASIAIASPVDVPPTVGGLTRYADTNPDPALLPREPKGKDGGKKTGGKGTRANDKQEPEEAPIFNIAGGNVTAGNWTSEFEETDSDDDMGVNDKLSDGGLTQGGDMDGPKHKGGKAQLKKVKKTKKKPKKHYKGHMVDFRKECQCRAAICPPQLITDPKSLCQCRNTAALACFINSNGGCPKPKKNKC